MKYLKETSLKELAVANFSWSFLGELPLSMIYYNNVDSDQLASEEVI